MYNPDNQYRCTIIRGKAKEKIDDLLPIYAGILQEICPAPIEEFAREFDEKLSIYLPGSTSKTLKNHRTEVVGKLFGMYYEEDQYCFISEQTERLIETEDQPAFFKNMCFKFQFPNGMDKASNIKIKANDGIKVRPCVYLVHLLKIAEQKRFAVSINDIGYYALNNLDVLQGRVSPEVVIRQIINDKNLGINNLVHEEGRNSSYSRQHIRELINYMELANLVRVSGNEVTLNLLEEKTIKEFLKEDYKTLLFPILEYDLESSDEVKALRLDFAKFYSRLAFRDATVFETHSEAMLDQVQISMENLDPVTANEIGDLGEKLVTNYEKKRVESFNSRYLSKVVPVGRTRGLGYDVQSIAAEGDNPEFVIYIEVKSTKRVTPPSESLRDTITLTRNEWQLANQHRGAFFVYRVYFTHGGVYLYKLNDPVTASENGDLRAEPIRYRVDFQSQKDFIEEI